MTDTKPISERIEVIQRKRIEDSRGWFLKAINGLEKGLPNHTGEVYVVTSENGNTRGGHYHKKATEWFTIIQGQTTLKLYDINTKEVLKIVLKISKPITVVIPPFVAHKFDAIENECFMILGYTDVLYCPDDTIVINM